MATKVECFRVEFLFDVICPHSWIGYKMLQSRRTRWEKANIHVEFIPVRRRKLLTLSKVETLLSMVPTKQQYIFHELKSLARQYHIEINRPECLGEFLEGAGSGNALLLLNLIRRERPAFYERAMEKTWTRIWSQNKPTHRAPHFFALCREIGFEFRDCDDLVSRIQLQSNANDVMQATKCAAEAGVYFAHFFSYSQCSILHHFICICFAHSVRFNAKKQSCRMCGTPNSTQRTSEI
uniref:DSBA-like thioredoxin domain-containing protein n=1 Tax=Parascaris univalens TaxID=6257 RepID=A0A915BX42_PARUN